MKKPAFEQVSQPGLFDPSEPVDELAITRFALGEFQERGFVLAGRDIALDRLIGAFNRASEVFGAHTLSDQSMATALAEIGAEIKELPPYVAKHPFRINVPAKVAAECLEFYVSRKEDLK